MKLRPVVLAAMTVLLLVCACGCGKSTSDNVRMAGNIRIDEVLPALLDRTTRTLSSISSADEAEQALPELEALNEDFDELLEYSQDLSPEGRQKVSSQAAAALPGIKDMARRLRENAGFDKIIGPTVNDMVWKIEQLL
jgi:ElaB/YqjD/DUF883 family membrane-anchored ribosome-binding protein